MAKIEATVVVFAGKGASTLLGLAISAPGAEREMIAVATSNLSMSDRLPSMVVLGAGAPEMSLDASMALTYHSGRAWWWTSILLGTDTFDWLLGCMRNLIIQPEQCVSCVKEVVLL